MNIFAAKQFYLERPEPEQSWTGLIEEVAVQQGPNTRALPFQLRTGSTAYPLYTSGPEENLLRPWIGQQVVIHGKLIDQSTEGFGMEIWPGTLQGFSERGR